MWQTDRVLIETYPGSRQTTIAFGDNGVMATDARELGVYPGEAPDEVSSLSHTAANYVVSGDSFHMSPSQIRYWNHSEGVNPPEHVIDVSPPSLDAVVHYEVHEDRLTLQIIAPKESPITVYHRVRQ